MPPAGARLHLICSGTPTPTPGRFGSCLVLAVAGERLMFDCGPAATDKLVKSGLFPTEIDHLFFTHHHYDHDADYPCFLLCRWDHETQDIPRLKVFGPPPTRLLTERLIGPQGAFVQDWRARTGHPASQAVYLRRGGRLPRPGPRPVVEDILPGAVINTRGCRVKASEAIHVQPFMDCLSYRIDWDGGSLLVSGDAGAGPGLLQLARGAATAVVNVWGLERDMSPDEGRGLCSLRDAGRLAARAGVRRLILAHQGPALDTAEIRAEALAEAASAFDGQIIFGREMTTIDLD